MIELGERSGERLANSLRRIDHQPVRGLHEERGRAEIDHEPRALHPSPLVDQHDRVSELVAERQHPVQGDEDERGCRDRRPGEGEVPGADDVQECDRSGRGDGSKDDDDRRGKDPEQHVIMDPAHHPIRAGPFDRERLGELLDLARDRRLGRDRTGDRGVDVQERGVEEPTHLELLHQIGDTAELEVAGVLEPVDDDLLDRAIPVEKRKDLDFTRLEPVVEQVPGVRDEGVVVAPSQMELLHLDVLGEPGARLGPVAQDREARVQGLLVRSRRLGACECGPELLPDVCPVETGAREPPGQQRVDRDRTRRPAATDARVPEQRRGEHDQPRCGHHRSDRDGGPPLLPAESCTRRHPVATRRSRGRYLRALASGSPKGTRPLHAGGRTVTRPPAPLSKSRSEVRGRRGRSGAQRFSTSSRGMFPAGSKPRVCP